MRINEVIFNTDDLKTPKNLSHENANYDFGPSKKIIKFTD